MVTSEHTVCRKCKTHGFSYRSGGQSPIPPDEVIHTDLEERLHTDRTGMNYVQVFVKIRDAAADATANYIDEMRWERVAIECICSGGAEELGASVRC